MTEQFKAGDLVYYPTKTTKVLQLKGNPGGLFCKLAIEIQGEKTPLRHNGRMTLSDINPIIFHATPENRELLTKLCGMDFDEPPKPKTSRDVVKAMLDSGIKYIICDVKNNVLDKNSKKLHNYTHKDVIKGFNVHDNFYGCNGIWEEAIPVDAKTGKVIIDYVDGEIVTE